MAAISGVGSAAKAWAVPDLKLQLLLSSRSSSRGTLEAFMQLPLASPSFQDFNSTSQDCIPPALVLCASVRHPMARCTMGSKPRRQRLRCPRARRPNLNT
jgi:hypothetical protein